MIAPHSQVAPAAMTTKLALAVVSILALSGCEPALIATPIDPPVVKQSFGEQEKAAALVKSWMFADEAKKLEQLVILSKKQSEVVFADPKAWPECKGIENMTSAMIDSGTVYGLTLAPDLYRRYTALGCALDEKPLADVYGSALKDVLADRKPEISEGDQLLVSQYLEFLSVQGMHDCSAHSMRVSREMDKPFHEAVASVKSDCTRPR